ncbi:MAG: hypothetical protein ACQEQN_00690 [Thermodesulfobacteriota bacterium]
MRTRTTHWLLLLILLVPAMAAATATDWYQAGVEAFQAEKYEEALAFFRRAQREGINTPNLRYNIGAAYYKTGQYKAAGKEFQKLADHPAWKPLALYNLGLTDEARGDTKAAIDHYSEAFTAAADSSRIKQRAALKLRELASTAANDTTGRAWYGLISASIGYDDNAVLAPDNSLNRVSKESDVFTDLYGFGGRYLKGSYDDGVRIDAGGYARLYAQEREYSYGTLFTGISKDNQYGAWRTRAGLAASADFVEDDFYAVTPALQLVLDHYRKDFRLRLANTFGWVKSDDTYTYLTGAKNRTTAEIKGPVSALKLTAGYEFEYNNRRDLRMEGEFFSYSPLRHKIYAEIDYPVAKNWTVTLRGELRRSMYPDANVRIDPADGQVIRKKREDDRIAFSLRTEYQVTGTVDIFAQYDRTDNDSNLPDYTYTSNQIMIGCQKTFN